jgi:hypothetical protein
MNKSNVIWYSVIAVLVCLVCGMGYMIYQNKIATMDNSIVGLNSQITNLQAQTFSLQSQNSALNSQINQLMIERDKAKNLKTFVSVEELRSFIANNAGYNFGSSVYDNSDVCVKIMLAARNQGYWMGLMPKQTISYYNAPLREDYYYNNSNCGNCNNCNNCNDYFYYSSRPSISYYNNSLYRNYNNYSSFSGVVNVAVVGGRDLYTIESGTVIYAGSMSTGF